MSPRFTSLLVGAGAAVSLGACQSLPDPPPPGAAFADRHAITVAQAGERLELEAGGAELTAKGRSDIAAFASGYLRYGHGALILSTPAGAGNADAANAVAQQAQRALAEAGVNHAAVASSTYDASGVADAPVVLSFTRFEAQAPECAPLWRQDLAHQSNNQPWDSFGCATQANLAAMVEDPHDLLRARDMDPRDSGRRDTVMDAYRDGERTHAERSPDERVAISNVAQ